MNSRPLHRQRMMDLRILQTEQADLHLMRVGQRVFIKPLPLYLLNHAFWKEYLCEDEELHKSACGFLLSYIWLICSRLDLRIAKEENLCLVPAVVEWTWWKSFVAEFEKKIDMNALDQVNMRYQFGELRLSRVNSIYRIRFFHTHFIRGYLYGYNRYVVFFQRNFSWILIIFVYFSLVLAAMQVGVSVDPLQKSVPFGRASYGFVVFSMVLVAFALGCITILFASIFFINMILAIKHDKVQRHEREKLAKQRKGI